MDNKLKTVDAETLLSTPMSKTMFIVDGLISQGVNVISGASKIGKSWLMLWLGLQVAQGNSIWGLPTLQCDVLYLSLEDTQRRIKDRLYNLTDSAPDNLYFAVTSGLIGGGLEEQITDFPLPSWSSLTRCKRCGTPKAAPEKRECTATTTTTFLPSSALPTASTSPFCWCITCESCKTATIPLTMSAVPPASSALRTPTSSCAASAAETPLRCWSAGGMWNIRN